MKPQTSRLLRGIFVLTLLFGSTWNASAQGTIRSDDPDWQRFKTLFMQYDSMTVAFQERQKTDSAFAADPKGVAGEEIDRYSALAQELMRSMPADVASADAVENFGIDDYRTLKFIAMVTEQMTLFPIANKGLIEYVADADSARMLKLELAQVALASGNFEEAQQYATQDVVENADPLRRAMLYAGFSQAWLQKKDLKNAQEWALRAISGYAEAEEISTKNPEADPREAEWIRGRYGVVLAPLMYELKEAGDAAGIDELTGLARNLLPESTTWAYVQTAINNAMTEIARERESLNQPAEVWAEHVWIGTEPLSLETLKGKVILIDFFATWCKPCIRAFPHLRDWQKKYEKDGLVIVGLTSYQGRYDGASLDKEQELKKLQEDFIPKHEITWPVGVEKDGRQTMQDYNVSGIPYVVLIDREGKVQYTKVGAADYDKTEMRIRELLAD
ncbi:MAG: TlpA family protein disulfide reductase [Bacteroidetes bacterium]|nr:TlpA family protein disulfide reductase [Bacteroidota bacterium]